MKELPEDCFLLSFLKNPTKLLEPDARPAIVHPDAKTLEWFAQGHLEGRAAIKVGNHLLGGCKVCSAILTKASPAGSPPLTASASSTPGPVLDWVTHVVQQPPARLALILENSRVPPAALVAEALEELSSGNVAEELGKLPRDLLLLAVDTLLGAGLHQPSMVDDLNDECPLDKPEAASTTSTTDPSTGPRLQVRDLPLFQRSQAVEGLVRIGSKLCQEHLRSGKIGQALQALRRVTAASTDAGLGGANRAALLVTTATVLRACEEDREWHCGISSDAADTAGLLAKNRYRALIEAQQLYALGRDQYQHSQCALRLAELVLSDAAQPPTEADNIHLEDLIRNLELHAERLASHGFNDLALIAQRYLTTAYQRASRWSCALLICEAAAKAHGLLGQQEARLTLVLESARILRKDKQTSRALHRYQEARRGLAMTGRPLLAAIASVEATRMQMEQDRSVQRNVPQKRKGERNSACLLDTGAFAAELSTVFASGELDRPTMAALLLLRESCLEGTMTLDQVQHCHDLLRASLP